MNSLIKIVAKLAFIATSTGQLPKINKEVRSAELKLLNESKRVSGLRRGYQNNLMDSYDPKNLSVILFI